jgi:hypothetical protein
VISWKKALEFHAAQTAHRFATVHWYNGGIWWKRLWKWTGIPFRMFERPLARVDREMPE